MIHKLHTQVEKALERVHSQLHARGLKLTTLAPGQYAADCIFKDDGTHPRGIPDIPYHFEFTDAEDWDAFIGRTWRFLESKIKQFRLTVL